MFKVFLDEFKEVCFYVDSFERTETYFEDDDYVIFKSCGKFFRIPFQWIFDIEKVEDEETTSEDASRKVYTVYLTESGSVHFYVDGYELKEEYFDTNFILLKLRDKTFKFPVSKIADIKCEDDEEDESMLINGGINMIWEGQNED